MNQGMAELRVREPAYIPQAGSLQVRQPEPLQIHDVVLHHLRTPAEIKEIVHLRDEIDLSAHTAAGRQQFDRLEKKETSWASSTDSSSRGSGSGRFASSRWAIN